CKAFLEVQRYPQAKVAVRRDGSSQPIFEREYPNRYYTTAALDESESIIVIIQIKVDADHPLEECVENKIAVEVIWLATGSTLFHEEDSYNCKEDLKAIEQGGCAVSIDSLVQWIQIWVFSYSQFSDRLGVRKILISPNHEGSRWFHDFRHIEPCHLNSSIFKLSGDGRHLLVATPYSAEFWEVRDGVPHAQLADIKFCDFGLIRRDDLLKGFVLESGFEFEVSDVCGYAVLDTLRRFDFVRRGLLAVVAPGSFDNVSRQQKMYQDTLSALPAHCDSEFIQNGVALFDAAMESPVADMRDLLNRRWAWTSSFPAKLGIKAWHVQTHDQYWARPVYLVQSRVADEFIFLRDGAFPEFTCEPLRFAQHIVSNEVRQENYISLGPVSNNGHLTMRSLTDRSSERLSRVELHQLDLNLQSETPICWLDVDCSVYEYLNGARLVGATDLAIFARTGSNEITIVRTDDANHPKRIFLDASIAGIYPVLDSKGRSCKCLVSTDKPFQLVSAMEDGSISILRAAKIASSNFRVKAVSTNGLTLVIEKTNGEIVVASKLAVEWRETRIWNPFEHFMSWVEFRQRESQRICAAFTTPHCWTLSHCGRLLACVCDMWLLVLDVQERRCLLKWKLPGQGVKSMSFDLSGRWLALTHSGNVWEEFEVMWNPVLTDDSATQTPERSR
ncbi:MAG TPA: hypothetical protein PLP58_07075, partial [Prosthecobacter sp.]|nr:hypothetical protein [Prosthecobacter sp.]